MSRSVIKSVVFGIGAGLALAALFVAGRTLLGDRPIEVPAGVAEPCASWFAQAPRFYPAQPPEGWSRSLAVTHNGEVLVFGEIPGHYWRFAGTREAVCGLHYNTDRSSATGEPDGALLYVVEGRMAELPIPSAETPQPDEPYRTWEQLLGDSPPEWLAGAPDEPGYVYWRSFYHPGRRRAEPLGFWLRHVALYDFTFDNGQSHGYAFHHEVKRGIDTEFAPKIIFDAGP